LRVGAKSSPGEVDIAAGPATPSVSAKMICEDEALKDIEQVLGQHVTKPLVPTWNDHVYSCDYVFATGTIVLSVRELADDKSAQQFFDQLSTTRGSRNTIALGDAAFQANDDSVVVRKDAKVLDVNVSRMPPVFGAFTHANVGANVAAMIMGCWTGD